MELVLLRHGQSEWNAENIFTGWADVDLSDVGMVEAVEAGGLMAEAEVIPDVVHTSLQKRAIRTAVAALRDRGVKDLAGLTLVSDGVGIYECTTANEVVDLLAGGQGVFGIAVGASLPGLREDIRSFPAEAVKGGRQNDMHDELAKRRGRVA